MGFSGSLLANSCLSWARQGLSLWYFSRPATTSCKFCLLIHWYLRGISGCTYCCSHSGERWSASAAKQTLAMPSPVSRPPWVTNLLMAWAYFPVQPSRQASSLLTSLAQEGLVAWGERRLMVVRRARTECRWSMLGSSRARKTGRKRACRQKLLLLLKREEGTTRYSLRKKDINLLLSSISTHQKQHTLLPHASIISYPYPSFRWHLQLQLMTKKLSDAFFGDKKFTEKVYSELLTSGQVGRQDVALIFEPYTSKLHSISNGSLSLLELFVQFIQGGIQRFRHWPFQKLSSAVEIAAHVFQRSFEEWYSREQSFKYFSDVLVRHSLFRPPHSVCIFNYEQLNEITSWWLNHFDRYFDQYQQCMASELNEVLIASALPAETHQTGLGEGKVVDKAEVLRFLQ